MSCSTDVCTCWRAPAQGGESHTAAWLFMQRRVAVTTRSGQQFEGRPRGPIWFPDGDVDQPGFEVELDDGSEVATPLSEMETITPLEAPNPVGILESVAHALLDPLAVEDGEVDFTAIAGPHEVLEVTLTVRRAPCMATRPPVPPFRIVVVNGPNT